jgi:hypothetical protein
MLAGEPLVISEFMAANTTVLADRLRGYPDWIELYNPTEQPVDLLDWALTDDADQPDKWRFPQVTLPPHETLIVFASGRDRVTGSELHTNFSLSSSGEYLALIRPDGSVAHDYAPDYPPQRGDVSYGIVMDGQTVHTDQLRFFAEPTPGEPNAAGYLGFGEPVDVDVKRGFFDTPFPVTMTTDTPGATIRYTIDGSLPTASNGEIYREAITVSTTTTLRAVAYTDTLAPSLPTTQTYVFLDAVLNQDGAGLPQQWGYFDDIGPTRPARMRANYQVDPDVVNDPLYRDTIKDDLRSIPTLSLVLDPQDLWDFEQGIYANPQSIGPAWERPVSLEWIQPDGSTAFSATAGLKIHGGWARRFSQTAKLSFRVNFQGQYGQPSLEYPMFGPDQATEFTELVLRGGFNDSWRVSEANNTYMQDQWTRLTQLDMGGYASRHTYVQLYLNGMYWGLYSPTERPNAQWAAHYRGGDPSEYDVINTGGNLVDGDLAAWSALNRALAPSRFDYEAIKEIVDIENFIDYLIVNQYVGNWDWPHNNWYASRHRVEGGKWQFHSWDAEAAFQNGTGVNRVAAAEISSSVGPSNLYLALLPVPEFRQLYADRIQKHFFGNGALTTTASEARLRSIASEIDRAIVGESARWGDGKDNAGRPVTRDRTWVPRIESLIRSYFPGRHERMLDQYRAAGLLPELTGPEFTPHGGRITAETPIQLSAPQGDIYFTRDGSDPRAPDGQLSDSAVRLNSIDLVTPASPAKMLIPSGASSEQNWQATTFDDAAWSLGTAAIGYDTGVAEDPIIVPSGFEVRAVSSATRLNIMTEAIAALAGQNQSRTVTHSGVSVINYHETGREANFGDSLAFPIGGNDFAMEIHGKLQVMRPGTYTLGVTSNDAASLSLNGQVLFADAERHPTRDTFVTVELTAGMHDVQMVMFQRLGSAILEFYYAPGTKTEFDHDFVLVGDAQHRPFDDAIQTDLGSQLLNTSASVFVRVPFQVDDPSRLNRLQLRMQYDDGFIAYLNGVEIARAAAPDTPSFQSTATGTRGDVAALQQQWIDLPDAMQLLQPGENVLSIHGLNLDAADVDLLLIPQLVAYPNDTSFQLSRSSSVRARVKIGDDWSPLAEARFSLAVPANQSNLRISEIHYHPADPTPAEQAAGFASGDEFEFIELVNISNQPIDLQHVQLRQTSVGEDVEGVAFDFRTSEISELGPGQRLVVVENRSAFELRYGTRLPIAGQWSGRLSNASERITLVADNATIHQFVYRDDWHPTTDGGGPSLERVDPTDVDLSRWADAAAWGPSAASGGTPGHDGRQRPGDANRDGVFDTADLLLIFQAGKFENIEAEHASWEHGDWDGDGKFTTRDLVLAFSQAELRDPAEWPGVLDVLAANRSVR